MESMETLTDLAAIVPEHAEGDRGTLSDRFPRVAGIQPRFAAFLYSRGLPLTREGIGAVANWEFFPFITACMDYAADLSIYGAFQAGGRWKFDCSADELDGACWLYAHSIRPQSNYC